MDEHFPKEIRNERNKNKDDFYKYLNSKISISFIHKFKRAKGRNAKEKFSKNNLTSDNISNLPTIKKKCKHSNSKFRKILLKKPLKESALNFPLKCFKIVPVHFQNALINSAIQNEFASLNQKENSFRPEHDMISKSPILSYYINRPLKSERHIFLQSYLCLNKLSKSTKNNIEILKILNKSIYNIQGPLQKKSMSLKTDRIPRKKSCEKYANPTSIPSHKGSDNLSSEYFYNDSKEKTKVILSKWNKNENFQDLTFKKKSNEIVCR